MKPNNLEEVLNDPFTKAYDEFMFWWKWRKQFREIINKYFLSDTIDVKECEHKFMDKKGIIEIKTLKDIIDKVPLWAIDIFLVDLKEWIKLNHDLNKMSEILPKWSIVHDNISLQWINDWKNYANIQINLLP